MKKIFCEYPFKTWTFFPMFPEIEKFEIYEYIYNCNFFLHKSPFPLTAGGGEGGGIKAIVDMYAKAFGPPPP